VNVEYLCKSFPCYSILFCAVLLAQNENSSKARLRCVLHTSAQRTTDVFDLVPHESVPSLFPTATSKALGREMGAEKGAFSPSQCVRGSVRAVA